VPEPGNPMAWDRYAYVQNNPVRYSDPSGHMLWEGDDGGYNYRDNANDEYRRQRNDVQTCQSGNANYCSYATLHPVETALFVGTSLGGSAALETFVLGGGAIGTYDALLWKAGSLCISNPICRILIGEVGELSTTDKSVSDDANTLCADGNCTNEISTGTNVVYQYVDENGITRYIGITNDFFRRAGEHLRTRGWTIQRIRGLEHLSRFNARAVEQVLIEHYGLENLYNHINRIAASKPIYQEAIQRGTDILRLVGILK